MNSSVKHQQQQMIIIGVISVIITGLIFGYFYLLDWREQEINLGYGKVARKNDFLAAELFLRQQNVASEQSIKHTLLDALADPGGVNKQNSPGVTIEDTLILVNARGMINGQRFEQLWQWVQNGGTLVTTLSNPYIGALQTEDELFQELDIQVEDGTNSDDFGSIFDVFGQSAEDDEEEQDIQHETSGTEPTQGESDTQEKPVSDSETFAYSDSYRCSDKKFVEISQGFVSETLQVDFNRGNSFYTDAYLPVWLAEQGNEDNSTYIAGMFRVGDGSVTVLRNAEIWRNWNIQCHDHAYFLWSLINKEGRVWFLENQNAPSLFSLVAHKLPYALLTLCILIGLTIWSALTRFGPIFQPQQLSRRRFSEHIQASATFLWKYGEYNLLVNNLRNIIEQTMARRVLGYERKSRAEQISLIAKFTHFEPEKLEPALFKKNIETLQEFVSFVKILKHIKDSL